MVEPWGTGGVDCLAGIDLSAAYGHIGGAGVGGDASG